MNADPGIHSVHPYPCKFPGWAITELLADGGGVLLDPFCGSGTTLLQGAKTGWRRVIGFDSNPIATMIARFKVAPTERAFWVAAEAVTRSLSAATFSELQGVEFTFTGREHWFSRGVLSEISRIVAWIERPRRADVRDWLRLSLSRIINRVSRQDSETRYVAVDKAIKGGETTARFIDSCTMTLAALRERGPLNAEARIECVDVRSRVPLDDASVDRIVTSPPYANTMDYYLYHKQRMNVLGFNFKVVQNAEIGSRHEFSSLKEPKAKWERDYAAALTEFQRVLRPGAEAFLIIGDSQIAGEKIDAAILTERLAGSLGFVSRILDSTPLNGRSLSFSHGFQRPNKYEHIIHLTAAARPLI